MGLALLLLLLSWLLRSRAQGPPTLAGYHFQVGAESLISCSRTEFNQIVQKTWNSRTGTKKGGIPWIPVSLYLQDNLLDQRFGPANGHTTFNTGRPVPDQVQGHRGTLTV